MKSAVYLRIVNDGTPPKETYYELSKPPLDPGVTGWRLTKSDGVSYDVLRDIDGRLLCQCESYHREHEPAGTVCKHGRALIERGLL